MECNGFDTVAAEEGWGWKGSGCGSAAGRAEDREGGGDVVDPEKAGMRMEGERMWLCSRQGRR